MTRGEFWAGKVVLASSLKIGNTLETVADVIVAESVRREVKGEHYFCAWFADGSWVKGELINGVPFGQILWGEK